MDWLFDDPKVSVLALLSEVQTKLPSVIAHLRQVSNL